MRPNDDISNRLFDIVGLLVLAAWLTVTAAYVYRHEFRVDDRTSTDAGSVDLREGTSWMLLRRNDRDIGFVRRSRTRLEAGWLVEYEAGLVLEIVDTSIPLTARVKARLDLEGRLEEFDATVRPARRAFEIQGDVDGRELALVYNPGTEPTRETLRLDSVPRLATTSTQHLLARGDLEPGDTIEQDYFDPISLGVQAMTLVYRGREEIDILGETHSATHVTQKVAGTNLDVYVDRTGDVLLQEFPLKIIGVRVDPELGRARSASLRKRVRQARNDLAGGDVGASIDRILEMLGLAEGPTTSDDVPAEETAGTSVGAPPANDTSSGDITEPERRDPRP